VLKFKRKFRRRLHDCDNYRVPVLTWDRLLQIPLFIQVGPVARRYSDWLRAGLFRDRIPVEARFFAHVETGPGAHPASCTMGTGSFPEVKRPGRDADHPPHSSVGGLLQGDLYLTFTLFIQVEHFPKCQRSRNRGNCNI
jgi:hypothetical protein